MSEMQRPPQPDLTPAELKVLELARRPEGVGASGVQRSLMIGYGAAFDLLHGMKRRGLLTPKSGSSGRYVLPAGDAAVKEDGRVRHDTNDDAGPDAILIRGMQPKPPTTRYEGDE